MKPVHCLLSGASALFLSLSSIASAHVCLDVPTSRAADMCQSHDLLEAATNTGQKVGPCGSSKGRMANPTVYKPGETITVKWTETIDHQPSWYRISFNPNGETFEDPTSYQDNTGKHPNTLKDGIQDSSSAAQEVQVTLPNITCDKCTLQLIQVMGDKGGNGFGGNDGSGGKTDNDDIYYACADIVLKGSAGDVAPGDAGSGAPPARPAPQDAGGGQAPLPPDAPRDAGAGPGTTVDAGSTSGGTGSDSGSVGGSGTGTVGTGGTDTSASTDEGDDGGCSVKHDRHSSRVGATVALLALLALSTRRRRRG